MKNPWIQLKLFYLFLLATILISCTTATTAKPTLQWRDPTYSGGPFENILIVGISNQETVRRVFEDQFVEKLKEGKIKATASYTEISPPDTQPTEDSIKKAITDIDFDSVLFTHLVGVEEEKVYRLPAYNMYPYEGMYGYYGYVGGYAYEPGYYSRNKLVRLETILYDAKTEKIVWSSQSETMNPNNETALIDATIKTVIKQLKLLELVIEKKEDKPNG